MKTLRFALMSIGSLACALACSAAHNELLAAAIPPSSQNLVLAAPITTWDEAVPLGNGLLGGLLWGEKNTLRLSLDRGDLWDERPVVEKQWWKKRTYALGKRLADQKKFDAINAMWDTPYNGATPTKLPAGCMEITLDPAQTLQVFELNLATAEGFARFTDGTKLDAFFSAAEPVAVLRIPGPEPKAIRLLSPMDVFRNHNGSDAGPSSGGSVDKLGYPEAKAGSEGTAKWYVQEAADGLAYCVCTESRRVGNETLVAVTVASTNDGADPLTLARKRCSSALAQGYEAMLKPHTDWWRKFWMQSSVSVPDLEIQRHYVLCRYYYGAASRRGAPPMPLQGVWTADCGGLPPWKGDYHNDLNTQMTYIGYQGAGNFDEGASYLDFLWQRRPTFEKFARDFYGTPGLACPGVMTLAGQPLGGWGQYSLSPTMSAWSAHLFYLHWRYTMDDAFLRDRAYPWCSGVGECMLALLKPDANGVLKLPLSSSPEIFDNSGRAWLEPNSNFDLMCLKMLFLSLDEMADACSNPDEAKKWAATAIALGDFHTGANDMLLVDAKTPLPGSHRHLSNIIGIYPFNLITREGGEKDLQRIHASLAQWDKLGTSQWCGYSFSWMSCLRARIGDGESAMRYLDIFVKAFILRNGFHANGDQTKSGFSSMIYRPFTLEGNFLAMQAVQEMLLQSWSPTPGKRDTEVIRIFPAVPWRWHDVSFTDLRAEGGHRVSAKRENNATTWFHIAAGRKGIVRIRDDFGGRTLHWSGGDVKKVGENFQVTLETGQAIEAILPKPAEIPAPPADVAKPVVVGGSGKVTASTLPPPTGMGAQRPATARKFKVGENAFLLDGKPLLIRAGELQPCRVPPEYWADRLRKARCMGLNTVAVYCFWNLSEPEPGQFDFTGFNDVARFVRQAQEESLYVVLRPGPYSCAERDFGGYPYWLLKERDLKVRSRDERFLLAAARYMKQLGKQLAPLQITRGGPILMVQVENEYGSYADPAQTGYVDEVYKGRIRDMIREAGFDVPLFTSDGVPQTPAGYLPDALPTINGGVGQAVLDTIRKYRPNGPFFVAEFYPGGLDHWGEKHSIVDGNQRAQQLDWFLAHGVSFNCYMLHGGTNLGFNNGANYSAKDGYQPQPTTYDYDFLLDDAGRPYPKFSQFRDVIAKHLPASTRLPDLPPPIPMIEILPVVLDQGVRLFDVLGKPVRSEKPLSMEDVNQAYGYILYRTKLPQPVKGELVIQKLRDYAVVLLNGTRVADLDRRHNQDKVSIDSPNANATLDILVENMGRINYGPEMLDNRKGITEKVTLGGRELTGWEIYPLPMTNIAAITFASKDARGPALYRGQFTLAKTGDTFLDMRGWGKGCAWINGHNLGRFWYVGPQQTLYVPGVWLKQGANEIVVFDLREHKHRSVQGLKDPILDQLQPEKQGKL